MNLGLYSKPEHVPKDKSFVHTVRDWKEYLGESILIIFSVILALVLTEYFNSLHEKENTRNTLKNIVAELSHNRLSIQEMKKYNAGVLDKINAALANKQLQDNLVTNDEFHLDLIAPQGVLYRFLDGEGWTIAKNSNALIKVDPETLAMLYKVYENQARMMKVEDEVARIIFDRSSRDPKQVHTSLILIRDIYHAWAVDRTDDLLKQIDSTIRKVNAF